MKYRVGRRQRQRHEPRQPETRYVIYAFDQCRTFLCLFRREGGYIQPILVSRAADSLSPLCQPCNCRDSVDAEESIASVYALSEGEFKTAVARHKTDNCMGVRVLIDDFRKRYHHCWRHGDHDHVRVMKSFMRVIRCPAYVPFMCKSPAAVLYADVLTELSGVGREHPHLMTLFSTVNSELCPYISPSDNRDLHSGSSCRQPFSGGCPGSFVMIRSCPSKGNIG